MSEKDQFTGLHWKKVKALVEEADGIWTDMEKGLIFLRGLGVPGNDEDSPADESSDKPGDDDVITDDDLVTEPVDESIPVLDMDEYHSTVAGDPKIAYVQNGHSFDHTKVYIDPKDVE